MAGIKIYTAKLNGVWLQKGITAQEFKSWIVHTLGGSSADILVHVTPTTDGGYVAVGNTDSEGQGLRDAMIVKYDSDLNVVAQKALGGTDYDYLVYVIQASDGDYVAVGYQSSQGQGANDAWIVKYDTNLNVVTQNALGGTSGEYFRSVTETSDGGYVAVGYQESQGQGNDDALIVKYDSNLNVVAQYALGGSGSDAYFSVTQTSDGGYVAVGHQLSQGQGLRDALIVKYDSNLNVTTQKGLGSTKHDYYVSVIQSSDGGYVAVGYQDSSDAQSYSDTLIVKYDSNLNVVAQKALGGSGFDYYLGVTQCNDGGYLAVGRQGSESQGSYDALVVKYDSNLNVVSQKTLGGSGYDSFDSVVQGSDGGYVVAGYQASDTQGSHDATIVKLPNDLELLTGTIINHPALSWNSTNLSEISTNFVETTPTLIATNTTLTQTATSLVETSMTSTETRSVKQ